MNITTELLKVANNLKEVEHVIDLRNCWKTFMKKLKTNTLNPKDVKVFQDFLRVNLLDNNICEKINKTDINTWEQMIENICNLDIQDYDAKSFDEYWRIINEIADSNRILIQTF